VSVRSGVGLPQFIVESDVVQVLFGVAKLGCERDQSTVTG
jgi:hypothetical protein